MKKNTNTKAKVANPEPQLTIGEYIDDRLNSMASGGHFGGAGSISKASAVWSIVEEYIEKYRVVKY
jgi:hypothetical protein